MIRQLECLKVVAGILLFSVPLAAQEDEDEVPPGFVDEDGNGLDDEAEAWPALAVRARLLFLEVYGKTRAGEGETDYVSGQTSRLREDLEIRRGRWLDIRPTLSFDPDNRIGIDFLYGDAKSEMTVDDPFEYNGAHYVRGEKLKQEFSLGFYGIEAEHRFVHEDNFTLWAGLGLALHSVNLKTEIDQAVVEHVDYLDGERAKSIVPYLRLEAELKLVEELSVVGELRAAAFGIDAFIGEPAQTRFVWTDVALRWTPADWISVDVGLTYMWDWTRYRGPELSGTPDDNKFRVHLWGPTVGVSIRF